MPPPYSSHLLPRQPEVTLTPASFLGTLLLVFALSYVLIGPSPFSKVDHQVIEEARGSVVNQLAWSLFAALGLTAFWANPFQARKFFLTSVPLMMLLVWCALSIFWAPDVTIASRRFIRLLFVFIAAAGIAVAVPSLRTFHRTALVVTGVVMFINFTSVFLVPGLARDDGGNFMGMYAHKNNAGIISTIAIFCWLSAARWSPDRMSRVLFYIGCGMWYIFTFFTASKTSIALSVLSPIAVITLVHIVRRYGLSAWFSVFTLFLTAMIFLAIMILFISPTFEQIVGIFVADTTVTGRTFLWRFMLEEISFHPWFGVGFGSFWGVGETSPAVIFGAGFISTANQGHNGYLDILLTTGVVGLILFFIFMMATFLYGIRSLYYSKGTGIYNMGAIEFLLYIIFAAVPYNITESSFLRGPHVLWLFFVLAYFIFIKAQYRNPGSTQPGFHAHSRAPGRNVERARGRHR